MPYSRTGLVDESSCIALLHRNIAIPVDINLPLPRWLPWVLVPILSIFAWAPALFPGYWASLLGLLPAMSLGDPSGAAVLGYSAKPFTSSMAALFLSLGFGVLDALRWIYALSVIGSGWTMYAFASAIYSRWTAGRPGICRLAALLSATLYVYLPFRFAAAFNLGEPAIGIALAGLPLFLWGAERAGRHGLDIASLAVLATGIGWINASQPAWGIPALVAALGVMLLGERRDVSQLVIAIGVVIAFGYSMLTGSHSTTNTSGLPDYVTLPQLLLPVWGSAPQGPGPAGGGAGLQMTYQLGLLPLLLAALATLVWFPEPAPAVAPVDSNVEFIDLDSADTPNILEQVQNAGLGAFVAAGWLFVLLLIALMLDWSPAHAIWSLVGSGYAWTLLGVAGCVLCILAGIPLLLLAQVRAGQFAWVATAAVLVLAVLLSQPLLSPRYMDGQDLQVQQFHHERLGDSVLLVGARVEHSVAPGGEVKVSLWWQPLGPAKTEYTTFIHMVTALGQPPVAQTDKRPLENGKDTYLMTDWKRGDLLVDSFTIKIPTDVKPGTYTLAMGMYVTGNPNERITIYDGDKAIGNMVAIGTVSVR